MATLILTAAGQALGGALGLGGAGSLLGKAAGALAGGALDQALFGASRTVETGRIADLSVQASNEGVSLPRVYGRARLSGQVIWATNFEEVVSEDSQGGKAGGSSVTVRSYSYFANFAVALCEGSIARVGRIWADGKPLDTSGINLRIYSGTETQAPDPLIAAFQSPAPAYRGTAYVVFERMALEHFGNRLPQLSFEVIRPVEPLEEQIRAVTLIPGAGEFVYAPDEVRETERPGVTRTVNRHVPGTASDWAASLDELTALCPNLESVALVISWFGDDLRAGVCSIRPKVEVLEKTTSGAVWSVCGATRAVALAVSRIDGRPALGGTPSDDTVIAAIKDLKARGLKVMLYPFLLMDIPPDADLPAPSGTGTQPPYPWRGRIEGGADATADANSFFGTVTAAAFSVQDGTVAYSGPAEWRYRRHILHLAHLAKAAGGVDAFLIGSELRGLTRSRAPDGSYPFVAKLVELAADARAVLGPAVALSYAADWSEYGAHQMSADELRFPLDPLWASPHIDFIGIDNYLPLTDMRENGTPGGSADEPSAVYDLELLRSGVTGGEYADWYYASDADRQAGLRAPITDGAYGKPWVYRAKDLKNWWANPHVERSGGQELSSPTPYQPQAKPIWFTELGFPAVDKGTNQPNVFVDPKSSESAVPHFSDGTRDDLIQRRALEASLSWWDDLHPRLGIGDNPVSPVYGGPMVAPGGIFLWSWDARPYPAFPAYTGVWADGANWQLGHWLTGRLGAASLDAIVNAVLADFEISPQDCAASGLEGLIEGFVVTGPSSARQALEPLIDAFGGLSHDRGTQILITGRRSASRAGILPCALARDGDAPLLSKTRAQANELTSEMRLSAEESVSDYRRRIAASRRLEGGSRQVETRDLPAAAAMDVLQQAADRRLHALWSERERVEFRLGPEAARFEPGDVVTLLGEPGKAYEPPVKVRIEAIETAGSRRIEAARLAHPRPPARPAPATPSRPFPGGGVGAAHALFLDLPILAGDDPGHGLRLAAFADPWPGTLSVLRAPGETGFEPLMSVQGPAVMGRLAAPLGAGPLWVVDEGSVVEVELFGGHLQSRSKTEVLSGRNALAVRSSSGGFEILQFIQAELVAPRRYRLSGLLRGQRGTEDEMRTGAAAGSDVVLLDPDRVPSVPLLPDQIGLALNYRILPQGAALNDPAAVALTHTASGRGRVPFAPVHLKARRTASGIEVSWIRQTRSASDSWEGMDVPLGEEREAYELDILDGGGVTKRTLSTGTPSALYPAADEHADFGGPVTSLSVAVCQLSQTAGRGTLRRQTLHVG
ncbi:putative tail protein [Roseibium hamelinense]|uniref:Putative tail protein n=1 Tax=Roseibium hamelinense TaxID=150831 RepID=A0A562T878_9HYPH|nr:glycoside hydrolase/phage tail family protein [Roseibium hamelinense]MTI43706.1 hypothetical protein [Roseibium hamelinense]TWI89388.1 putative tail protein [Roseibium hamelinense]